MVDRSTRLDMAAGVLDAAKDITSELDITDRAESLAYTHDDVEAQELVSTITADFDGGRLTAIAGAYMDAQHIDPDGWRDSMLTDPDHGGQSVYEISLRSGLFDALCLWWDAPTGNIMSMASGLMDKWETTGRKAYMDPGLVRLPDASTLGPDHDTLLVSMNTGMVGYSRQLLGIDVNDDHGILAFAGMIAGGADAYRNRDDYLRRLAVARQERADREYAKGLSGD